MAGRARSWRGSLLCNAASFISRPLLASIPLRTRVSVVEYFAMRQPRLKAPPHHPVAFYHCVSRVIHQMMLLGDVEKDKFVSLMREYAQFCGVYIVSYCIMTNHFHITVAVPKPPEDLIGHEWLLERLEGLTVKHSVASDARQKINKFLKAGALDLVQKLVDRYRALMWDISQFMKLLKQRFTTFFNELHAVSGTLWESRFHSTLIEGTGSALTAVAAYIELNPVRAGMVKDPADYQWSSYSQACRGDKSALDGIRTVVAGAQGVDVEEMTAEEAMRAYRGLLIGTSAMDAGAWDALASEQRQLAPNADESGADLNVSVVVPPILLGPTKAEILEKVLGDQPVSLSEFIQIRVRYFTDGAVLGSKEFVNEIFQEFRARFGPDPFEIGTPVRGLDAKENLFSLRNLRKRLFG